MKFPNWLKWWICRRELESLHRYRVACAEAARWMAHIEPVALTAGWIDSRGQDCTGMSISDLRGRILGAHPELDR